MNRIPNVDASLQRGFFYYKKLALAHTLQGQALQMWSGIIYFLGDVSGFSSITHDRSCLANDLFFNVFYLTFLFSTFFI
jgi:hypothetical protein